MLNMNFFPPPVVIFRAILFPWLLAKWPRGKGHSGMSGEHGLHNLEEPIWWQGSFHPHPCSLSVLLSGWEDEDGLRECLGTFGYLTWWDSQLVKGEGTAGNESCDQTILCIYQDCVLLLWQCLHILLTNAALKMDVLVLGSPSVSFHWSWKLEHHVREPNKAGSHPGGHI